MLRLDILTCVPALFAGPFGHSILKRAQDKGLVEIAVHDLRDFTTDKHQQVDDYPFGGGAGMVLKIEPIAAAIRHLQSQRTYDRVIYLTPEGPRFDQHAANELSLCQNLLLLAGHYKGIDQRARELFITHEVSIGDYVLSGGELPAMVLVDAVVRLLPGVLGDETSALTDSFQDGLLEPPIYTRPADFEGHRVPDILLSGHFAQIDRWRDEQAYEKTRRLRPDLLAEGD